MEAVLTLAQADTEARRMIGDVSVTEYSQLLTRQVAGWANRVYDGDLPPRAKPFKADGDEGTSRKHMRGQVKLAPASSDFDADEEDNVEDHDGEEEGEDEGEAEVAAEKAVDEEQALSKSRAILTVQSNSMTLSTPNTSDDAAADWCLRLHGWPIMPLLLGVYDFTDRFALATDQCLRLHGWPIMPPLLGVYDFIAGLPPSSPTGVSASTAGLLCRRCWACMSSPTGWPLPPLIGVSACTAGLLCRHCWASTSSPPFMDVHVFTDRLGFAAGDWCLCLHSWPIMPLLLGVYDFTAGLPLSPPTGVLAYMVGWPHHRSWASTSSPTGLPLLPLTGMDQLEHHHRLAFAAADWCLRLHGWHIMPPLLGAVGRRLRLHRRLAFTAADWCLRLHGWPIMPPLLGVYIFTDRPPRMTPTGVIVFTAGHVAATASRRHHLQRKLSASAADWFLHSHGCMILILLIGLIVFTVGCLTFYFSNSNYFTGNFGFWTLP
uniref:cysteine dioxygenase n=1 Tax=Oryza sativa subsp. japonica TaxID=39947 RepID=Q6Z2R6_ORYSJ|nr:HGWP repeat containing protein-like [Oryza sativa Japonica Group]